MADVMFSELAKVIEQVGKDKGIDKAVVVEAITQAMLIAARKKFGTYREIEATYNEDSGEVELYEFKEVVEREKFIDDEVEIPMDEAQKLDPNVQLGDSIGIKLEAPDLGRIAAQTAKQIILQKVRDAERRQNFTSFGALSWESKQHSLDHWLPSPRDTWEKVVYRRKGGRCVGRAYSGARSRKEYRGL
jgi:N utilization substance protein A